MNPRLPYLREKAAALPLRPGVYLMKDKEGKILYVGKSRALCNRVGSYFVGTHNRKTERLVSAIYDFDTVFCDSEIEALSLENTLIKQHTPHYNIRLKDAKSYPYIKLLAGEYPRLCVVRDRRGEGEFYGPYSGTAPAYAAMEAVNRIFRLPTCRRVFPRDVGKDRPCLYYQMGRCIGPCTGAVSKEEYQSLVTAAAAVLRGDVRKTVKNLEKQMTAAAEAERYEEAARHRDSIKALEHLREKQKAVGEEGKDRDVFSLFVDDTCGVLALLSVRDGKLCGHNEFLFTSPIAENGEEMSGFLFDYYKDGDAVPDEILLSFSVEEKDVLETVFSTRARRRVHIEVPQKGEKKKFCDLALANAKQRASRYREETAREDKTLIRLSALLGLEVVPDRIEAYDISNIGDECITGAMAVYENGKTNPSAYRTFNVKTTAGADDYGAMREVLSRRLSHIGDGSPSLGERPDLILLDGGVGHVHVGREVLKECGQDIPLFGMVKDDFHKTRGLTDGENEIRIAAEREVFTLLYKLQEEVHRVAVSHTMGAKRKTLRRSSLEKIEGIGPTKAKKLLAAFGSIKRLSKAQEDDVRSLDGITAKDAAAVYRYFHRNEEKDL